MRYAPYDLSLDTDTDRADALFASPLQRSDQPSATQIRQAIVTATSTLGRTGCAARVAQEYGEHPETAPARMRWARATVAVAFAGSSGSCPSPGASGIRASRPRSQRSQPAAACA
jgi:hypothetical protein